MHDLGMSLCDLENGIHRQPSRKVLDKNFMCKIENGYGTGMAGHNVEPEAVLIGGGGVTWAEEKAWGGSGC